MAVNEMARNEAVNQGPRRMSSYVLTLRTPECVVDPEKHWVMVGWDMDRKTFYAQIHDRAVIEERFVSFDDPAHLLTTIGGEQGQYPHIEAFEQALAPYACLAPSVRTMLITNQQGKPR